MSIQQGGTIGTVTNYQLLARQVTIQAPAASTGSPLRLAFLLDSTLVGSTDPTTIDVLRDGVPIAACADGSGAANPDPCLASRTVLAGGDLQLVVLTSHASRWNFGIRLDTTPPTIRSVSASPNVLWPANHKLVPVTLTVDAVDAVDPAPTCKIASVASSEPVDGLGDGDTAPDWTITGALSANLRAERSGIGPGRTYTVAVRCTDAAGNAANATVPVTVPHNAPK